MVFMGRGAAGFVAGLLLLAGACSQPRAARWRDLTQGFLPPDLPRLDGTQASERVRFVRDSEGLRLQVVLRPEDWTRSRKPDRWYASARIRGYGVSGAPEELQRVSARGRSFTHVGARRLRDNQDMQPGEFVILKVGKIFMQLDEGEALPEEVKVELLLSQGEVQADGGWRVEGKRFSGRALPVWPGQSTTWSGDIPPASTLRFATCVEPALWLDEGPAPRFDYRLHLNGELLFEHSQSYSERSQRGEGSARLPTAGSYVWHQVPLPQDGLDQARLRFEVSGSLAYTSFFTPTLGPARVGRPGQRPWGDSRADIVVFLADTFRADNLAFYGSTDGLTPEIDAFAQKSVAFERAWSVSTYTLPAHASMFTGLFPRQCGADSFDRALPEALVTIAEELSQLGYRTGAVTDSAVVSQAFNLDQGFEWLDEQNDGLASTLRRASDFLSHDDGRPVFLWLQTYRAHKPFRVSPETRAEHGERLALDASVDFEQVHARILELGERWNTDLDQAEQVRRELEALYRGGSRDLDRGFGRFLRDLERRGYLDEGYLILTSDHGEAFLEHGELYHSGTVYEEQIRVPLFIHGAGLEPRRVQHAASLVDLTPTLAAMAGSSPRPGWMGTSLLALDRDRPVFAYQCLPYLREDSPGSSMAVIEGAQKWIGYEDSGRGGAWLGAFDLSEDPGERNNKLEADPDWGRADLERLLPAAEELLLPLVDPESVELDADRLEQLRAMGYAGGD